jgi:hypothetical protein
MDLAQDREGVSCVCECGIENSASVKCGEFFDQLRIGQLLQKESIP